MVVNVNLGVGVMAASLQPSLFRSYFRATNML
jgi:hypothetical protein